MFCNELVEPSQLDTVKVSSGGSVSIGGSWFSIMPTDSLLREVVRSSLASGSFLDGMVMQVSSVQAAEVTRLHGSSVHDLSPLGRTAHRANSRK